MHPKLSFSLGGVKPGPPMTWRGTIWNPKIAAAPEAPTFANTIEAMELAEETLDRVSGVFYNLVGADSTPEREALRAIMDAGLHDTYRLFEPGPGNFSWWDYRQAAFRRNLGLRIDLVLASAALRARCRGAGIDRDPRTWDRPSDHAPVWAEFA